MKIVDSFLFSEVYEKEVLLLKFILEDEGVNEWILLENAYSFQGDYTGLHARKIMDNDARFDRFRKKLTIIEKEEKTEFLPKHEFLDELSLKVEIWQRGLAYNRFIEKYNNEDWILVSDVDEIIDFTSLKRKKELFVKLNRSKCGLVTFPTRRYWYDFDNAYLQTIGNAMCTKKYLKSTQKKLHEIRYENRGKLKGKWKNIIAFEYSSCYSSEYIIRKFYTGLHTGFTPNDLKQSLRCNHRPTRELATWRAENSKYWFFEKVKLTKKNSPDFVRENFGCYKTNSIDKNYKKNRREDYPELFKISYFINRFITLKKNWINKKWKAFRYKMKIYFKYNWH
jgi:hypothetical protein